MLCDGGANLKAPPFLHRIPLLGVRLGCLAVSASVSLLP